MSINEVNALLGEIAAVFTALAALIAACRRSGGRSK